MQFLTNARIRTLNPAQPFATALAMEGGRIIACGLDADVLALRQRSEPVEDLHGATVWPGLTDAHIHLQQTAFSLDLISCETATREECLANVARRAPQLAEGKWLLGHGWNQNRWNGVFGSAVELDSVSCGHPAYLTAKSLHAAWANSAALRIAGITCHTPDPEGGKIVRNADGTPTGILLESAVLLVEKVIPPRTSEEIRASMDAAQSYLHSLGITGVHDYDPVSCFTALQELEAENRLHLRVIKGIPLAQFTAACEAGLRSGFGGDWIRTGWLKLFADGALGPHTAAMLEPYEETANQLGMLTMSEEEISEICARAHAHGISVATHAIGDRANRTVLNAYEKAGKGTTYRSLPDRIEHVQRIDPQDLPRLAALNVTASMQPIHATSDMEMAERNWGLRCATAYAWRSVLSSGAKLVFGSDSPVETPNPFKGMHAAVTRQRSNGLPKNGWYSEQCLRLEEALLAYTSTPAEISGQKFETGRIGNGSFADIIILNDDPFHLEPAAIEQVTPVAVMAGGSWVWKR